MTRKNSKRYDGHGAAPVMIILHLPIPILVRNGINTLVSYEVSRGRPARKLSH